MQFVVLGSGTSVPHPKRSSSGYWLETENGSLMLDFSASAIHRLAQEKLDWANLDAIWISHFHLDHIGGLAPFLFGTKYAPETQERKKPLRIFGATKRAISSGSTGLLSRPAAAFLMKTFSGNPTRSTGLSRSINCGSPAA